MIHDVIKQVETIGFLPVIQLNHPERDAVNLAAALIEGGIPSAEVTFRAEGADRAIRLMREAYPEMLVGAGTVVTLEQAKAAVDAGAQFIVSPGFDESVVDYAIEQSVAVFPGAVTPTEIIACMKKGLDVVKFFPAEQFGGLNTIKALSAPFKNLRFIPTGGVQADNLGHYIALPAVLACGGSFMIKQEWLDTGNWAEITRLSRMTREIIDAARGVVLP